MKDGGMQMTNELIQRDIVGYEGLYTVDIFGNVFKSDGKELTQYKNKYGYINVSLRKEGKYRQHKVHRLVAQAFIPNPSSKEQVNHIDGNKNNNVVWNLEWNTSKENVQHSIRTGLRKTTKVKVVETGEIYDNAVECAKAINGSYADIYKCLHGERQTHKKFHYMEVTN